MIYLRAYRVLRSPNGNTRLYKVTFPEKISFHYEDMNFNIFDPKEWRRFLANDFRMPNGKRLPNNTEDGDDVVYSVYSFGSPTFVRQHFKEKWNSEDRIGGKFYLFPGYHDNSRERRDCTIFGRIRKPRQTKVKV